MVKKLVRHGKNAALVIDMPILELIRANAETAFELATDGRNLILSPQTEEIPENAISESLKNINAKYGKVLQRLGE
jgi:hypothetical protein